MTTWINGDFTFPRRAVNIVITDEQLHRRLADYAEHDPVGMERYLNVLFAHVEGGRYAHATIRALQYRLEACQWMVMIEHPSLPVIAHGMQLPRVELVITPNDLQWVTPDDLPEALRHEVVRQRALINNG